MVDLHENIVYHLARKNVATATDLPEVSVRTRFLLKGRMVDLRSFSVDLVRVLLNP